MTLPVLFPGIFSGCLFAFLLSWGNFPLSLYTTGADTTVPEYLYAKMVAGYTPGVPVLGTVSTIGAIVMLLGGYALITLVAAGTRAARRQRPDPRRREESRMLTSVAGQVRRRHRREQGHRQGHRPRLRQERRQGAGRRAPRRRRPKRRRKEIGNGASAFAADVTKLADMEAMAKAAAERHGGIDVLCANAGIFPQAKIEDMSPEQWDEVLDTNLKGTFLAVKACVPYLKKTGAGPHRHHLLDHRPDHRLSRLDALRRVQIRPARLHAHRCIELAKYGITVNAVMPGNIVTEGLEGLGADYLKTMAASIPLKRLGTVEDIGYAALFFASKEAGYITGQTIVVDGGQILPELLEALKD